MWHRYTVPSIKQKVSIALRQSVRVAPKLRDRVVAADWTLLIRVLSVRR